MAKVKLKQPTKKLTPQRTMEVADSLKNKFIINFKQQKTLKDLVMNLKEKV